MTDASPLMEYSLRLADNALILGHRLSEWTGHGPTLEEDIALANLALDLIGQARALYTYTGEIEGKDRDEDAFAYHRDAHEFRNCLLVEQPSGDFGHTIVRHFLYAAFLHPFYTKLMESQDETLAAIAAKAEKELSYHLRHAGEWMIRLGDGTEESHSRVQTALDALWPFAGELFEMDDVEQDLARQGIAVDTASLRGDWDKTVDHVLARATLTRPQTDWQPSGGRTGQHGEKFGYLLAEMQFLQRAYPGATW